MSRDKIKEPYVNFQKIRTTALIKPVLKDHEVDWLKKTSDNLVGRCPYLEQAERQAAFQLR